MPVTYLTAHHMLHHLGHLEKDNLCLSTAVQVGGNGGIAIMSVGRLTCLGNGIGFKAHIIEKYGGKPIDRHNEDFVSIIKSVTNGQGVDHILDPIGGENLKRSLSVLAEGGKLYTYGMSAAAPSSKRSIIKAFSPEKTPKFDPLRLMTRNRGVFGIHMGTWKNEVVMAQQLNRIMEGLSKAISNQSLIRFLKPKMLQRRINTYMMQKISVKFFSSSISNRNRCLKPEAL